MKNPGPKKRSFADSDSADLAEKSHLEIAYGNRICRRKFRRFRFGGSFANFDSADLSEIAYGNRMEIVRKSRMEIAYGNHPAQISQISIQRIFRKLRMEIAYEIVWAS